MSSFRNGNFVGLHRGDEADFLQRNHPAAFLLLCLISRRARYTEEPCPVTGLRFGEALIGDWKEAGLTSEKSYRCAKSRLEKGQLCAFRRASTGARRGTIATLLPQGIFSISYTAGADDEAGKGQGKGREGAGKGRQTTKEPRNKGTKETETPPQPPKGECEGEKVKYPNYPEFESYLLEKLPEDNPNWTPDQIKRAAKLQFETFIESKKKDGKWRNGHGKIVENWKTGTRNIMKHKIEQNRTGRSATSHAPPETTVAELMNGKSANIINASELNLEDPSSHD